MSPATKKLYLREPFLSECNAQVVSIIGNGVVLDQTVAFPESAWQEGDRGNIIFGWNNGSQYLIPFTDTQEERFCLELFVDVPIAQENATIVHYVNAIDLPFFVSGSKVRVSIEINRRARLTANHTGLHLVLIGIEQFHPYLMHAMSGCHVGEDCLQLDFFTQEQFSVAALQQLTEFVNDLVRNNANNSRLPPNDETQSWFWPTLSANYCCLGTHLPLSRDLGYVRFKRRNIGRGVERIVAVFPDLKLPLTHYYCCSSYK